MSKRHRTTKQSRLLSLVLVSLALALRLLYVPVHLAQEDHVGLLGHPHSHVSVEGEDGHVHEEHRAPRDGHDEDHDPHPALDHESELIVQRSSVASIVLGGPALLSAGDVSLRIAVESTRASAPDPDPPRERPRVARPLRGPPAAA